MQDAFSEMEEILGEKGAEVIARARIAVFGLGGVGQAACEALARCGVASITVVDPGRLAAADIGHQLLALRSSVGKSRTAAAAQRMNEIDERILVHTYETAFQKETAELFDLGGFDYVIDTIPAAREKLLLIRGAEKAGVPVISCTGLEGRMKSSSLVIADVTRGSVSAGARELRRELRKAGVRRVKALFSREKAIKAPEGRKASAGYLPAIAGFMIAEEVIRDLCAPAGKKQERMRKKD